jgi:FtsP/CotA-like multicopper oxidase with cupredoxin domain
MTSMADMMDMANGMEVKLGAIEIWNRTNRSNDTHSFHLHDVQYQILDRDVTASAANEAGLKDTVLVSPGETVRLIMRFTDFADPITPYMYHCHLLNQEDNGMMGSSSLSEVQRVNQARFGGRLNLRAVRHGSATRVPPLSAQPGQRSLSLA